MQVTFAEFGNDIASTRLRAQIPQRELKKLGIDRGFDILVYGKHIINMNQTIRFKLRVYDICDDHFNDQFSEYYREHASKAHLITCNSEAMKEIICRIFPELMPQYSFTETNGANNGKVMQMWQETQEWTKILSGLPQRLCKELEKIQSNDIGTEEKGQLQELCRRLSEKGENTEEAMRKMWGDQFSNAPPRLRQAIRNYLVMPSMPHASPRGTKSVVVIPDPYESDEQKADMGNGLLWYGHESNIKTILPYMDLNPKILSGEEWSRKKQLAMLNDCAIVLIPTDFRRGKSANRMIEAIRNGRFVVAGELPAHDEFKDLMWVGDIREGVEWALSNKKEVIERIKAAQDYVRDRYSPETIGKQWKRTLDELWRKEV